MSLCVTGVLEGYLCLQELYQLVPPANFIEYFLKNYVYYIYISSISLFLCGDSSSKAACSGKNDVEN